MPTNFNNDLVAETFLLAISSLLSCPIKQRRSLLLCPFLEFVHF